MFGLPCMLLLSGFAFADPVAPAESADLQRAFENAAREHQVPVEILLAIGWEATRWNQSAFTMWAGYGIMDLIDADREPSLEHAARILDVSPDLLIRDASWNIRGAAALLAWQARLSNGGTLPRTQELAAWWDSVRAFSRSENPETQHRYAATIYDIIARGAELKTRGGLVRLEPRLVDYRAHVSPPSTCSTCDYGGAASFVSACGSNYTNANRPSDYGIWYVIVHTVQGSYSGCISWFQNCSSEVSAHYVVRSSDGQITQMVREQDIGWHAGNWDYNTHSVGIEHEGYVDAPSTWYTDSMYRGSAALVSDIVSRNGIPADRDHIMGHVEVPGATHTDPGSGWDWDYYMSLIEGSSGSGTANLIGVVADTDIYNGARLVGATVWLDSGESTLTDADGYYHFSSEPLGSYTIHATAPGYLEGACSKDVTSGGEWWCSIALLPDDSVEKTPDDTETPEPDTADPEDDPEDDPRDPPSGKEQTRLRPGDPVLLSETGKGCGCAVASSSTSDPASSRTSPLGPLLLSLVTGLTLLLGRRRA